MSRVEDRSAPEEAPTAMSGSADAGRRRFVDAVLGSVSEIAQLSYKNKNQYKFLPVIMLNFLSSIVGYGTIPKGGMYVQTCGALYG